MTHVRFHVKCGLHRIWKKRFLPSPYENVWAGKHVPKSQRNEPGVVTFGRLIPKKEQKVLIRQVRPITEFMPRWMLDADIPDAWDWRAVKMPDGSVKDFTCNQGFSQGPKGSCTSAGGTGMLGNLELKAETFPKRGLCKMQLYNNARNRGGLLNPPQEGAYMIHVMLAAKEDGVCREVLKPYDVNDPEFDSWPFKRQALMMEDAANFKITDFGLVAPEGQESEWVDLQCRVIYFFGAVDMGTPWTSDWSQNLTGHMRVPSGSLDGGHSWDTLAYLILERDANRKITRALFYGRNSWDAQWPLGTTTGDFDYPSETLNCAKWKDYGGMENYRAVTAETHICPENEHWSFADQKCVPDGEEPEPSDPCEPEFTECIGDVTDLWTDIICTIKYYICEINRLFGSHWTYKANKKKGTVTIYEAPGWPLHTLSVKKQKAPKKKMAKKK